MGYSRENYRKIKEQYKEKRLRAQQLAESRRVEIEQRIPEIAKIDRALAETAINILKETTAGKVGLDARLARLKKENEELQTIRGDILAHHGYPRDYTQVQYECALCQDTGYYQMKLCPCMKRALTLAGYESSGVGGLMQTQRFETFSLDYYEGQQREQMQEYFNICYRFAAEFGHTDVKNLMFSGQTGTGKTHLSTAIAKVVIDGGHDVVYDTAQNVFAAFAHHQFDRRNAYEDEPDETEKYFSCDLLILDDLGTELTNQFTVSCLYHLINTRINHGASMIISTNLTPSELGERYEDRILSRFMGEFLPLRFMGKDIRMERLRQRREM